MSLPAFLDVVIGIIFMYLMLSLMCTVVNEIIATLFKLRAKYLSNAIFKIIDDPKIREAFYNHGLIAEAQTASGGEPPPKPPKANGEGKPKDKSHPSYIDSRNFAMALLDSLNSDHQSDPKSQTAFPDYQQIADLVGKMEDSAIRDVLLSSLAVAKNDITSLRDSVSTWFDTAMDRLSGEYKRASKAIAIIVGIIVAGIANADTWMVGKALWDDPQLRAQITEAAKSYQPPQPCAEPDPAAQIKCSVGNFEKGVNDLRPLPLGWHFDRPVEMPSGTAAQQAQWWAWKVLAFIWTGLALSLGAPFWFDLLQKVMNIRGAGPNPDEKRKRA